jgi:nucleotide-binding universal stress UspA family protein
MSYKSILVNLDIDGPIAPIVTAAADLAKRYEARLIGFCAADAPLPITGPGGEGLAVEAWQQLMADIEHRFRELREQFDKQVAGAVETEWYDVLENPTRALARLSRTADLVVMGASEGAATGDVYRKSDPGSVVLQAGRPLLVVARGADRVAARKIAVAWKDTREARRAVADAVPLLLMADEVTVVSVVPEIDPWTSEGVADAVAFLGRHGISARSEIIESSDDSGRLLGFFGSFEADLVVSGAYGHSRLREWVFGGMTRSLLDETGRNRFMSS